MRKLDPVEVVAIAVPVLLEFTAVCLFMGMVAVWAAVIVGN